MTGRTRGKTPSERAKELARSKCLRIWDVSVAEFDSHFPITKGKLFFRTLRDVAAHYPDWNTVKAVLKNASETRIAAHKKRHTPGLQVQDLKEILRQAPANQGAAVALPAPLDGDEEIVDVEITVDHDEEANAKKDDEHNTIKDENVDGDDLYEDGREQIGSEMDYGTPNPIEHGEVQQTASILSNLNEGCDADLIHHCIKSVASAYPLSACVPHPAFLNDTNMAPITPTRTQSILLPINIGNAMNQGRWGLAVISLISGAAPAVKIYDTMITGTDTYHAEVQQEVRDILGELADAYHPQLDDILPDVQEIPLIFTPCSKKYAQLMRDHTAAALFTTALRIVAGKEVPADTDDVDAWVWLTFKCFEHEAESYLESSGLADLLLPEPPRPEPVEDDEDEAARHKSWLQERSQWREERKAASTVARDMLDVLTAVISQSVAQDSDRSKIKALLDATRAMMMEENKFHDLEHNYINAELQRRMGGLRKQLDGVNNALERFQRGREAIEQLLDGRI
ncbi:hypothetical protein B0T21DRAFT_416952 [Apiosordaria backusii]|uniref:Uncharacterized protein n=1 Tax=Apiosordaria backusii TaxID=314023 RepID=A0AA40DJV1_9PEZI|nr:hypothetical protein B0T21DRAFT_416952 [Apiosordaria backusii]